MTGVFTINYPATMAVIDRMTKLVEKLKKINERYESEISTLSRCRGTTKNPHNHDSQISIYRKIISNNSKDIVDLGLLISQIFSLMVNTKMTDFYLTQLIKNMMPGDSNVPNPKTSVIDVDLSKQAAILAGVGVTATGSPRIMSATDYQNYQAALTYLKSLEPLKAQAREYEAKGQYGAANAMNQYINSHTLKNIEEIKKYVGKFADDSVLQSNPAVRDLESRGINIDEILMNKNSEVRTASLVKGKSYKVVATESEKTDGCITKSEYNYLVATIAGEAGGVSVSNAFGCASAFLNGWEINCKKPDIMTYLYTACWKWDQREVLGYQEYLDVNTGELSTDPDKAKEIQKAKDGVDAALAGNRAFDKSVICWVGNNKYNRFSTTPRESRDFTEIERLEKESSGF